MRTSTGLALVAALAAAATGCSQVHYTSTERYDRGLVVCLSGAGGMMGECDRIRDGLASGGVDRAIEIFDWSTGEVLSDQLSVADNRRKAAQLSRRIESYERDYPGRPVHVVGVSAGTGLTVWAIEDLADDVKITGAVLIASSLDTKYDLSKALARITDHLYSFSSVADTINSLGVTWAGTVDRGGHLAGGLVGFSPPDNASDEAKALYKDKLVQIGWWPGDVILGHLGDHLGATNPNFVRLRIAPLVLGQSAAAANGNRNEAAPAAPPADTKKPAARGPVRHKEPGKDRFRDWKVVDRTPVQDAGPAAVSTEKRAETADAAPPIGDAKFLHEPEKLP